MSGSESFASDQPTCRFTANIVRISPAQGIDPECQSRASAPQQKTPLFDHFVGRREQRVRSERRNLR
jgi:hypothetical protein